MSVCRVKKDVAVVVFDVPGQGPVHLVAGMPFDSADAVVRLHPDYFTTDDKTVSPQRVTEVVVGGVEQATAAPGEKRNR